MLATGKGHFLLGEIFQPRVVNMVIHHVHSELPELQEQLAADDLN